MLNTSFKSMLLAVCVLSVSALATSQSVTHALTGTVTAVNSEAKTVQVFTDNRAQSVFTDMTDPKSPVQIDKVFRTLGTTSDAFRDKKAYAIILYVEGRDAKSAIALRDLGKGPFAASKGLIARVENKDTIVVTDETDGDKSFKLTSSTIAETAMGAVVGAKYQPHKGDKVRVVATSDNGILTAVFVQVISAN